MTHLPEFFVYLHHAIINTLQIYSIFVNMPNISLIIFTIVCILFEIIRIMEEKETKQAINERIETIINKEGHTIATFAKKIGVPWTTVKNIVSGRNAPSYDIMVRIIEAVSWVDANYLVMGESTSSTPSSPSLMPIIEAQQKTIESQQVTIDRLTKKLLDLGK